MRLEDGTKPSPPWLEKYRFHKGHPPTPGAGRPKKKPVTEIYEKMLTEGATKKEIESAVRQIIKQRSSTTVQMLKELTDRVEGAVRNEDPKQENIIPIFLRLEIVDSHDADSD